MLSQHQENRLFGEILWRSICRITMNVFYRIHFPASRSHAAPLNIHSAVLWSFGELFGHPMEDYLVNPLYRICF